jgi:hypothetical protein
VFEIALLPIMLRVPFVLRFFEVDIPALSSEVLVRFSLVMLAYGGVQYALARRFSWKNSV